MACLALDPAAQGNIMIIDQKDNCIKHVGSKEKLEELQFGHSSAPHLARCVKCSGDRGSAVQCTTVVVRAVQCSTVPVLCSAVHYSCGACGAVQCSSSGGAVQCSAVQLWCAQCSTVAVQTKTVQQFTTIVHITVVRGGEQW
jgi:hypothetical protein